MGADRFGAPAVGVVNRTLAVKLLRADGAGAAALGRRVSYDGSNWVTIVGVVDDVHYEGLATPVMPAVYTPLAQWPEPGYNLIVRTAGEPMAVVPATRRGCRASDPRPASRPGVRPWFLPLPRRFLCSSRSFVPVFADAGANARSA